MDPFYLQIIVTCFTAALIGISKSGLPAVGMLSVPLMLQVFPSKQSIGIVLPLLLFSDCLAFYYYRQYLKKEVILRLIIPIALGIFAGAFLLVNIENEELFKRMIGWGLLFLLSFKLVARKLSDNSIQKPWIAWPVAFIGAANTTVSHVGGPFFSLYYLSCNLSKMAFMGAYASTFLMINCAKFTLYLQQGICNSTTFYYSSFAFPFALLGSLLGKKLLPHIPKELFYKIIMALVFIAGIKLVCT